MIISKKVLIIVENQELLGIFKILTAAVLRRKSLYYPLGDAHRLYTKG